MPGVAAASLIEMRTPPTRCRRQKSGRPACQMLPKPFAAVLISTAHASPPCAGSIRTSRLPDATTPTMHAFTAAVGRPPSNRNCNRSIRAPLPVPKAFRRLIETSRCADQVLDRSRRKEITRRVAFVDAEIFGAHDHAPLAQLRDRAAIAFQSDGRVAGDAANRLLAFGVVATQQ